MGEKHGIIPDFMYVKYGIIPDFVSFLEVICIFES